MAGVVAEVLSVSRVVPEPPAIADCPKPHVGAGVTTGVILLHDRFTVPLKPFSGAIVIVEVADAPAATEAGESGEAAMVKSGAGSTVKPTVVLWLKEVNVPLMVSVEIPIGVAAVVLTVSVDVAAVTPGVTGVGAKPQVAPAGSPSAAQVSATGLLNPLAAVTVTV